MEIENDNKLPYLDTLVYKENRRLVTTIYKKPTHSAQYITAQSNHPIHVKRGVIKTLTHRIHRLCMKEEDRKKELKELEKELKQNGHSTKFIRNAMQDRRRRTDDTPQLDPIATLQIPYIKGFAEKVRSWAKDVNIRVCFSSKHTIRRSLCGTKPTNINIDDKGSIYCIPLSCGKRYVGESGRPLNHVMAEMRQECKCHGMSGSCTVKTCWMRLPNFRVIGDALKDRFDGASRVMVSNEGNVRGSSVGKKSRYNFQLNPYNPEHKPPGVKDLVYLETSPGFCEKNPALGIQGTHGRQCNDTSIGVDGCDLMCCGRGYRTQEITVVERCACAFIWCCEVKCKTCRTKKTIHTCL
ncbi:hypothetical protein M8J77_011396 [Diaphorina citri]|nr:hypothetical protein M8J77_011396 [Diaphorina citri]